MPYIQIYDSGEDLTLIGETTLDKIRKEYSDCVEVSEKEMKEWLPIIEKYHWIKNEIRKRPKIWGSI